MHFYSSGRGFGPVMWVACVLVVVAFVFIMNNDSTPSADFSPSQRLINASPQAAIRSLMQGFESQGYTVETVREMQPPNESEYYKFEFEYNVTSSDGSQTWHYLWEWTVPVQLVTTEAASRIRGNENAEPLEDERFNYLLGMATLEPLTEDAARQMETLEGMMHGG